jgi:hypothetical protein
MFDIDPKFTKFFWKGLFEGIGKSLNFSTIYHQELDGKKKRVN